MLPLISFETGRKTQTQSSGQQKNAAPANGSLVLSRNHGREATTRGEEIKTNLHPRSSEARRESFCPLDKDLSWKSDNRNVFFAEIPSVNRNLAWHSEENSLPRSEWSPCGPDGENSIQTWALRVSSLHLVVPRPPD